MPMTLLRNMGHARHSQLEDSASALKRPLQCGNSMSEHLLLFKGQTLVLSFLTCVLLLQSPASPAAQPVLLGALRAACFA